MWCNNFNLIDRIPLEKITPKNARNSQQFFLLKKTTLCQAKTNKLECRNITNVKKPDRKVLSSEENLTGSNLMPPERCCLRKYIKRLVYETFILLNILLDLCKHFKYCFLIFNFFLKVCVLDPFVCARFNSCKCSSNVLKCVFHIAWTLLEILICRTNGSCTVSKITVYGKGGISKHILTNLYYTNCNEITSNIYLEKSLIHDHIRFLVYRMLCSEIEF